MRNNRRDGRPPAACDRTPVTPGSVLHRLMVLVAGEVAREPPRESRQPAGSDRQRQADGQEKHRRSQKPASKAGRRSET